MQIQSQITLALCSLQYSRGSPYIRVCVSCGLLVPVTSFGPAVESKKVVLQTTDFSNCCTLTLNQKYLVFLLKLSSDR